MVKNTIFKENGHVGLKQATAYLTDHSHVRHEIANTDENKERGNWSNKLEFILSCLSYAVGLGNIWRFPYLVYNNGGGAFLIPYFIMLLTAGLPLFFLELAFGQYSSEGPITIWKISPLFKGLGYGMFLVSGMVGIYYNMIIAWSWFYLFSSFSSKLPWASCENPWNTEACRRYDQINCTSIGGIAFNNGSCLTQDMVDNETFFHVKGMQVEKKMPSDEYFHNYMLVISEGLHDLGNLRWELAGCLALSWILCYFALLKGVKSFGKLTYFTAFFPYVVMTILLVRSAFLPGYIDGIKFYLTPQWDKLFTAKVWGDAAIQIFFSLSPCWGGLITLASYNTFHNNCYRDALLVGLINPLTSVFAGFVIFGIIGFMAHKLGVGVEEVAGQGAGLAFIAYPEAVTHLPLAPFWSIIFFVMLLTLGMGTQFTVLETVVTTIIDQWPEKLRKNHKWVLLAVCCTMYSIGLILCTEGGMYALQLMDSFCATYSTLFIGLFEVVVISWIYGVDRFLDDIKVMLGQYPFHPLYWKACWLFITPTMLLGILIFTWIDFTPPKYYDYTYPDWSVALGWLLSAISMSTLPAFAIWQVSKLDGPIWQRIVKLCKPVDSWGPKLQIHRAETDRPRHIDSQVPLAANPSLVDALEYDIHSDLPDLIEKPEDEDHSDDDGGLRFKMEVISETGV